MIRFVRAAAISGCAIGLLISLAATSGCMSAPPPVDGRVQIERVAKWRTLYMARNNRKPPKDEAEFKAFIEKTLQGNGETLPPDMFISPRDNKEWVIRYGPDTAKLSDDAILVHEQEGYDGKILIASVGGYSSEIDASELPAKLEIK